MVADDQFELISQLGRGGMGVVWKARDTTTGEIVALKLLHDLYAGDAEYVARFEREVELGRRVDSPNVVKVLGFGRRDGVPFLAMEYVDGPSLKERLKQHGPYTWQEAKPLLLQIAHGLEAAHAAGIVHRDVKPSNILLAPDGTAKLADFGIARANDVTSLTGTSAILGTVAYMAPEGQRDERSDLYSLGAVAYEMLAGHPPFEGDTPQEIWTAQTAGSVDLSLVGDASARKVIAWLLAAKPAERPQSASALVAVLEGSSKVPFSPSYWQRPPQGPRLNTMLRLAATFILANFVANLGLAAVAGGVAVLNLHPRSNEPLRTEAVTSPTPMPQPVGAVFASSATPIPSATALRAAPPPAPTSLTYDQNILAASLEVDLSWHADAQPVDAYIVEERWFEDGEMQSVARSEDPACAQYIGKCPGWFPSGWVGGLVDQLPVNYVQVCYSLVAYAHGQFSAPSSELCITQNSAEVPPKPVILSVGKAPFCGNQEVGVSLDIDQLDHPPQGLIGVSLLVNGVPQGGGIYPSSPHNTPGSIAVDCYSQALVGTRVCYTAESFNADGLSSVSEPVCTDRPGA